METLLIFAAIVLVTLLFNGLRVLLGDEWPPIIPEPERAADPSPEPVEVELAQPARQEAPVTVIPEAAVAAPASASVPAPTTDAPDEPAPSAPPQIERAPVEPLSAAALRTLAWSLIGGGAFLALSAHLVSRVMPDGQRLPAFMLVLLGGLFLMFGLRSLMRGALPGWLDRLVGRLAIWLGIAPVQVALLLMAPAFAGLARVAAGDGLLAHQAVIATSAWLLAVALVVAGSVVRGDRRPLNVDRWDIILSVALFAGALALRAWQMTVYPDTYSGDEGSAGLFAVEMLTGKANNLFGIGWFSFPSLYFTVQSAAIALFGQTVEAVRLTSAVAGALTVLALYWLGRVMFGRTTAILAAAYLAASHYHIHMSRIALNNIWDGLFGTLAILGLWHGWQSGRRSAFILCGLALGLGQYFYVSIRILPIMFLIWAAVAFWRRRDQFRDRFAGLALAAFIALVVYMPLGLYFAANPDEFQAPMNRVTILGNWMDSELARGERTQSEILIDQFVKGVMGFTHEPLRLLYNPGSPLLLTSAGFLFLLGILWTLLNFDLRYLLLLMPLAGVVAANTISQDPPSSQRYVLAMPMVAIFVALPLAQAMAWLQGQYPRMRTAVVVAGFALLALVAAVDLDYYFNRVYDHYTLGGGNTLTATKVAYFLRDKEPADEQVFFFGFPRMGYFSHATISFLAPEKRGQDVIDPLTGPPDFDPGQPALFIFLPERLNDLTFVRQAYPGGSYQEFFADDGSLLFAVYER